jgi:hypothetical protein
MIEVAVLLEAGRVRTRRPHQKSNALPLVGRGASNRTAVFLTIRARVITLLPNALRTGIGPLNPTAASVTAPSPGRPTTDTIGNVPRTSRTLLPAVRQVSLRAPLIA